MKAVQKADAVHARHGARTHTKRTGTVFPENKRSGPHEPAGVQCGAAESETGAFQELFKAGVEGSYNEDHEVRRKEYLKKPHFHHNHESNC
jgi:hypothetical protein